MPNNAQALESTFDKNAKSVEKSHDEKANAKNVSKPAKDSRIVDEKSGLFKDSQGRALGVRNRRESAEIADLSLQAESTSKKPTPIAIAFLSVLYSGRSPKAPGTAGSALSVLLGLPILLYSAQTLFLLACLLGIIAVREIDKWEAYSGKHDEKWIVIDELVGVWLVMAIIGAVAGCSVSLMILAFGTFRLFDIWKPSIIGRVDRKLKGGLGVVLDDVLAGLVAGVFSLVVLAILSRFGVDLSLW